MEHYYTDDTIFGPENWFNFGRCYREAVDFLPADTPSNIVEVGCWKGRSTAFLGVEVLNSGKPVTIHAIDTFAGSAEHLKEGIVPDNLFDIFCANLKPVTEIMGKRFKIYHMPSTRAAKRFKDHSVDFVFLDGSHAVGDVVADISAWLPKVKPGGVLAGDDWRWPSVRIAVEHQLGRNRVQVAKDLLNPWWRYFTPA